MRRTATTLTTDLLTLHSHIDYTFDFEVYCEKQLPGQYQMSNKVIDIVKRLVFTIKNTRRSRTTCY